MTTEIISLISSVGFPIVVAWYLLTQLKKTLEDNTKSNEAIREVLIKICEKLDIENK